MFLIQCRVKEESEWQAGQSARAWYTGLSAKYKKQCADVHHFSSQQRAKRDAINWTGARY